MATVNIPSTCNDLQYRYNMPRLVSRKEGSGNGKQTCIVNMGDVARALKRPPQYTTKWFGCELCALSMYTCREGEGERAIVKGHHDTQVFQALLDKFIEKYVLCRHCHLPEIGMYVKKGSIQAKCMACGWAGDLDSAHRLAAFVAKNPPDETGLNIVTQAEVGAGKMDKKQRREMKLKAKEEKKEKGASDDGGGEKEEEEDKNGKREKNEKGEDEDEEEKKEKEKRKEETTEKKEKKEKKEGKEKKEKKERKEKKEAKEAKEKKEHIQNVPTDSDAESDDSDAGKAKRRRHEGRRLRHPDHGAGKEDGDAGRVL